MQRGRVPHKRHTQFRKPTTARCTRRSSSASRASPAARRSSTTTRPPTQTHQIDDPTPVELESADPGGSAPHRHHLVNTKALEPAGDALTGRVPLFFNADVTFGVVRPAEPMERLLPQRRGGRDVLRPRGHRHAGDQSSGRSTTAPATTWSSPSAPPIGSCPAAGVEQRMLWLECPSEIEPPQALPQRVRPAAGALAVLPARHPPAGRDGAASPRPRRLRDRGAQPRPDHAYHYHHHPVRRGRLGRLPVAVRLQHRRLRADHRARPPAAAGAPDLPAAQLRDLQLRAAQVRLPPARHPGAVQPLEHQQRRGHLLRGRQLHEPPRRGHQLASPSIRPASRTGRTRARSRRASARRRPRSWRS